MSFHQNQCNNLH